MMVILNYRKNCFENLFLLHLKQCSRKHIFYSFVRNILIYEYQILTITGSSASWAPLTGRGAKYSQPNTLISQEKLERVADGW